VPYEFTDHRTTEKDRLATFEKARAAAVAGIDAGRPALISSEETGLVLGYTDGGRTLLGRPPYEQADGYVPLQHVQFLVNTQIPGTDLYAPWVIATLTPGKKMAPRKDIIVESLQRALTLARTEQFPAKPGSVYASGFHAWDLWISQLRDPKRFAAMDPGALSTAMLANGQIYYSLVDARFSAAVFLRSIAGEFDAEATGHLRAAADIYETLAKKHLCQRSPTAVAPMPFMLKKDQTWTQDMRNAQADILAAALALEHQALAEMEAALATAGR
jgi:hypothetical protein